MSAAVEAASVGAREAALIDARQAVAAVERAEWDKLQDACKRFGTASERADQCRQRWAAANDALNAVKAVQ
jgi:hypothetical protein